MTTINEELTTAHPWLSADKADWLLQHRIECFREELELGGDELAKALAKAVHIYKTMPEERLRNTIARFEEHHL